MSCILRLHSGKIGLRGWEKCYGKNKPVSSILHKDLFLFGPFGSFEETAKINPPWYVMDSFSQCIECCLQQSHPHVSELFTSVFWGFMTLAAKGVGCCGVSVGGDGTLVFELFSRRGWRGRSLGGVGLLPLFLSLYIFRVYIKTGGTQILLFSSLFGSLVLNYLVAEGCSSSAGLLPSQWPCSYFWPNSFQMWPMFEMWPMF